MAHPIKHVVHQTPMLKALGGLFVEALRQRISGVPTVAPETPSTPIAVTLPPRDAGMVADYIRWARGDRGAWRGQVPHHLFAQWCLPFSQQLLAGVPYPLAKAVNAGCRMQINGPLPIGEPLQVTAQLEAIDDDGRRAILKQRFTTGTADEPELLVSWLDALIPLGGGGEKKAHKPRPTVPADAREIAFERVAANAGFEFACLTGDFNPLHWITPYAKALGFKSTILHGFGTLALALEAMNRVLWAGDTTRLETVEVRFTRPVRLPGRVGVLVHDGGVFVGDAPGGPARLIGNFTTRSAS